MERTVEITKNRFFEIFSDAVLLYEISLSESRVSAKAALAKSCILSVNYALEAAANSFISTVEVTSSLKNQIDRFSTLDKFDFVLQWHKDSALPRGDTEVQVVKELIDKRNTAVHPKIETCSEGISTEVGSGSLGYVHKLKSGSESARNKLSKFSKAPDMYTDEDALVALKAVVNFLNSYVNDWWGIDIDTSALLLMPSWNGSINASNILYERDSLETVVKHDKVLGIKFLGLHGILKQFV
ncbi:hypothetical protein QWY20_03765 [Alkalimonas sp. MEB108]|uniref:HEPN AbiU2-like domain-containing protein n=1 Tax=Alkalimonas cellulosilytica TaxID=3058395 RepID=A0ABU7J2H0_9GAMM|nr:hypothetical protein [Alkalimonas sp. MEB108]MEE2000558.1 hypothetical protein [Alkalimonas sp. MEB108]